MSYGPLNHISPSTGESYRQFVVRAHNALMATITDPDERNEVVWKQWYSAHGDPLGDRARKKFSVDKFRYAPNQCYFIEHETKSQRTGQPIRYAAKEIADIVDEHRDRENTGFYSALSDGHTIDGAPDKMQPRVVGYAGNYKLGMIGYENPKFAVFADEWHENSEVPTFDKKRRRSVEVNRFTDGSRRPYLDPVALLGSTSPRLPLPVAQYSMSSEGVEVERYSFVLDQYMDGAGPMTSVSGSNSYLPSAGTKKTRYEDQNPMDTNPDASGDQTSLIQQLVQAILSTPQMQWVTNQMQSEGQGQQPGQPPASGAPPAQSPVPPQPQSAPGAPPVQDKDKDGYGMGMGAPAMPRYEDDKDLTERYSALYESHTELAEKYQQLADVNSRNMEQLVSLTKGYVALEQRAVDADRRVAVTELYQRHPQFAQVESVEEQLDKCLYSRGSKLDDEGFASHLETIEKYAAKFSPTTQMLPGGEPLESEKDRFSAEDSQRVVERYQLEMNKGNILSYDAVRQLIASERAK